MVNKKLRIIFFGTPEVAANFLKDATKTEAVLCVFTQSDKPKGRKLMLTASAVKTAALKLSLPVYQPEKLSNEDVKIIKNFKPDVGVVVAYGKLIPQSVFSIPLYGCFNIHFSLLPKYRGAAPVQWALINGESKTGVSSFWLEKTLDSGPVLVQKEMSVLPQDSAKELFEKLTTLGIEVMHETLDKIKKGDCAGIKQEGTVTVAHSLKKSDGFIKWQKNAQDILNLIRGTNPWPSAHTAMVLNAQTTTFKVIGAKIFTGPIGENFVCGQLISILPKKGIVIACGLGALLIETVHPANKVVVGADIFAINNKIPLGFIFEQYESVEKIFGGMK
ncbi:MAG: methionyl-tRNA formyltransferase [Endomicrobiales bacterium]|nr:methionyl-tRNA formyltransferase [Endomicrobiales bacterium]